MENKCHQLLFGLSVLESKVATQQPRVLAPGGHRGLPFFSKTMLVQPTVIFWGIVSKALLQLGGGEGGRGRFILFLFTATDRERKCRLYEITFGK